MTLTFLVFFLSFGNINVVRRDYQMVKNYNFSERLSNGRTMCPAIQGFVRSVPNSDRTWTPPQF